MNRQGSDNVRPSFFKGWHFSSVRVGLEGGGGEVRPEPLSSPELKTQPGLAAKQGVPSH